MAKKKTEKVEPIRRAIPAARQAAPFKIGNAVMRIQGCFMHDLVEITELSANGLVYFGKFLTGPKAGQEFTCPVRAVKEAK